MNKKSQAALEFLTTYGWAFLVIIIMIGTLAYFGILSPSKLLPNRCNFGTEFQCLDHQIVIVNEGSALRLRLKNNVGEAINVDKITFTSESTTTFSCTTTTATPIAWSTTVPLGINSWTSGSIEDIKFSTCTGGGLVAGEKGKIGVVIEYHSVASGTTYSKQVKGEVFSTVRP